MFKLHRLWMSDTGTARPDSGVCVTSQKTKKETVLLCGILTHVQTTLLKLKDGAGMVLYYRMWRMRPAEDGQTRGIRGLDFFFACLLDVYKIF